jgi:hypothetical protein
MAGIETFFGCFFIVVSCCWNWWTYSMSVCWICEPFQSVNRSEQWQEPRDTPPLVGGRIVPPQARQHAAPSSSSITELMQVVRALLPRGDQVSWS